VAGEVEGELGDVAGVDAEVGGVLGGARGVEGRLKSSAPLRMTKSPAMGR